MARNTRRKAGRRKESVADRERRADKQQVQRALRQEREIRALARRLSAEITKSDDALDHLAVTLWSRSEKLGTVAQELADRARPGAPAAAPSSDFPLRDPADYDEPAEVR